MSKVPSNKSLKNKANKLTNTGEKNNSIKSEEKEHEIKNIPTIIKSNKKKKKQ